VTLTRSGVEPSPTATGEAPASAPALAGPHLRHEPALDGLRGLAVVAVVVFHLDRLQGGFLGVDLFFVLSGFLITSLLVSEHHRSGAIDLGRFWSRRARRLLPALFLMLVGVSVLLLRFTAEADRARFRGDELATLFYVANWHRMFAEVGYWDIFSVPSPLDHAWSLAIEEQFYLVWPLVALGLLGWNTRRKAEVSGQAEPEVEGEARRPRHARASRDRQLFAVAVAGALTSLVLLALTFDPDDTNRAYFGTDTRLGPTLLGAALALWAVRRPRREGPPHPAVEVTAVAALAVMAVEVLAVDGLAPFYYRGGLALFAVATVVVIRCVTGGPPGLLAKALSLWPLTILGTISYGVYLWHWPIIVFVTPERAGVAGWKLDTLRVALTLAVAGVSYVLVEQPIRRGALRGWPIRLTTAVAVPVTLAFIIVGTAGTRQPSPEAAVTTRVPVAGSTNPALIYPAEIPPDATRVMLVGDSGVYHLGPPFAAAGPENGAIVATSSQILCSPANPEGKTRGPDGQVAEREPCHEHRRQLWSQMVTAFDPDVVVYYLANAGGVGKVLLDGEWVLDCDASYDAYIEDALLTDADLLGAGGATVVFTTTPYVQLPVREKDERVDCRNDTYERVVDERPDSALVDLNGFVGGQVAGGTAMFVDGIHFDEPGAELVSDWLFPQVLPYARPR
jgi:peptidoglycan/LPS O-acetylase OafA/YrhL